MLASNLANVKLISFLVAMWDGEGEQAANCKLTDQRIITGLHINLSYQENDNIFPRCTALGCWVIIMCTCSQYPGQYTGLRCPATGHAQEVSCSLLAAVNKAELCCVLGAGW